MKCVLLRLGLQAATSSSNAPFSAHNRFKFVISRCTTLHSTGNKCKKRFKKLKKSYD